MELSATQDAIMVSRGRHHRHRASLSYIYCQVRIT